MQVEGRKRSDAEERLSRRPVAAPVFPMRTGDHVEDDEPPSDKEGDCADATADEALQQLRLVRAQLVEHQHVSGVVGEVDQRRRQHKSEQLHASHEAPAHARRRLRL
eukprot:5839935-Pleurochrysis_carterae.AAC.1